MFCCLFGMHKDEAVNFLVRELVKSMKISFMSAKDNRSLCYNYQVWCRHLGNSVCQELEQSDLLLVCLRKLGQLNGMLPLFVTLRLAPGHVETWSLL